MQVTVDTDKDTLSTLKQQKETGNLAPLLHTKLRAQLAFADATKASDIMRTSIILIERVRAYYQAVEYCGPGMIRRDSRTEHPCALAAELTHYYAGNYRQTVSVCHPAEGPQAVWDRAGMMCLDTALAIAEWEVGKAFPESDWLLKKAMIAARSACKSNAFNGLYWYDARRRIGTKRIRKMLDTVLQNLQDAYLVVDPDTGLAGFQSEQFFLAVRTSMETLASRYGKSFQFSRPTGLSKESTAAFA